MPPSNACPLYPVSTLISMLTNIYWSHDKVSSCRLDSGTQWWTVHGQYQSPSFRKKSPLEFIDYTGVFIKFITQGPINGSKKGISVPSRNLQSSCKNYTHNSRREYLIVKRNDADKRAEEKETNESNMIRAGRLEPGNCDWVRGKRKTF